MKAINGAGPKLNRRRVNEFKVQYLLAMRTMLREMARVNQSPESLAAAEAVEHQVNRAVLPED
jgi:hypothetical protein